MEGEALCYTSGEDVQLGDRVQYSGSYATVVVVSNGESYETAPGYEDYAGIDRGLTVCDDDGDERELSIDLRVAHVAALGSAPLAGLAASVSAALGGVEK